MKISRLSRNLNLFLILLISSQLALAEIQITDSHGKYSFEEPPQRVVVLNWALAEQMLELGVKPVGMADIDGFSKHAHSPQVPLNTVDVGKRLSPALPKIKQLKPDIIVIGYSQRSLLRPLSNIATVIYFKNFGARYNNFEKSRERFTEIAKLFDKRELAAQKLSQLDNKLLELRGSLKSEFIQRNKQLPMVQLNVPSIERPNRSGTETWLFSKNSMPHYAALALGLNALSATEADQYGVSKHSEAELKDLIAQQTDDGSLSNRPPVCELTLGSYAQGTKSHAVSESNCQHQLNYQNAFGGTMSILYLAESIHEALIASLD